MIERLRTLALIPCLLLATALAGTSCDCGTARDNPFDPDNPDKPDDLFELTVVSEGLALRLAWKALDLPVQEYRIYKLEVAGAGVANDGEPADGAVPPGTPFAVAPGSQNTLLDEAIIVGGAKYHYWITAFHAKYGESPHSNVAVYDAMEDLDRDTHSEDDCIDNDSLVHPDAIELCDGKDNDCDGEVDEDQADVDGDGYIAASCAGGDDCNDNDARVNPGATEVCDGKDNDCDGATDEDVTDGDGDGHDGVLCGGDDCDDGYDDVYPGAAEICDGRDNDCDGAIDGADDDLQGGDNDGDGSLAAFCGGDDCDDTDASVHPGATEGCDGIDNDCDGLTDGDDPDLQGGDGDGDGVAGTACGGTDCDDGDAATYPGAPEVCDGRDNDCDGSLPDVELDADSDGFKGCEGDCDDSTDQARPGATEICGDSIDNDCDGFTDNLDIDGDGHLDAACGGDDCDDNNASVNPGANEICGNLVDDNCNSQIDEQDADGDSFDSAGCGGPDCDDNDAAVHPGAEEICDGKDSDCDGQLPADEADGDGDGVRLCDGDCHDFDPEVYPGADEVCDGRDNNCNDEVDEVAVDADQDGYVSSACQGGDDCNDGDAAVNPAADEVCGDGEDNNCSGAADDLDDDNDSYVALACNGDDCNDGDDGINPGANEVCGNTIDDNCNGQTDESDSDGDSHDSTGCGGDDCNDNDNTVYPGATEICDMQDNDCDTEIDENQADGDSDGHVDANCVGGTDCDDGDANVRPGAAEQCGDTIDQDCSGDPDDKDADQDGHRDEACGGDDCNDIDNTIHPDFREMCGDTIDQDCSGDPDDKDADEDGHIDAACGGDDCNDDDAGTHPGLDEVCGDGADNDCNGTPDDKDIDGDSFVDSTCLGGTDCNDGNDQIYPGALDVCGDLIDQDCNGQIDDTDADGDSYIDDQCGGNDCADDNAAVNPGANEVCGNSVDDNCNGTVDEQDSDGDGYDSIACGGGTDCNDNDPESFPGATEKCDDLDNSCEGDTDEGCDDDADGYCDDALTLVGDPAICPAGGGDCQDGNSGINPGILEICGNAEDEDCSGVVDDRDADGDTYIAEVCGGNDCNDNDDTVYPDAPEACDAKDNDCDTEIDEDPADFDNDGFISVQCGGGNDCNDFDPDVNPDAEEVCDGKDNDCNGATDDRDEDGDSFIAQACGGNDCDDDAATINPAAAEICGNSVDENCSALLDDKDADFDGYIDAAPACGGDDCNDDNEDINPGANEDCSTPDDDNCNGTVNEGDADNDGYDSTLCGGTDCNDNDDEVNPGAVEVCDGKDNDCNDEIDEVATDNDNDGYISDVCGGGDDCNDNDEDINPGAVEICGNAVDEDCSGGVDDLDADRDGYVSNAPACGGDDCADNDPNVNPGEFERCGDGVNNDCTGGVDDLDADGDGHLHIDCGGDDCDDFDDNTYPGATEVCDGKDNDCAGGPGASEVDGDGDGYAGCVEVACQGSPKLLVVADSWTRAALDNFVGFMAPDNTIVDIQAWDGTNPAPDGFDVALFADGGQPGPDGQEPRPFSSQAAAALRSFVQGGGGLVLLEFASIREHFSGPQDLVALGLFDSGFTPDPGPGSMNWEWNVRAPTHPLAAGVPGNFGGPNTITDPWAQARPGTTVVFDSNDWDPTPTPMLLAGLRGSGRVAHFNMTGHYGSFVEPLEDDNIGRLLGNSVFWTHQCASFQGDDCDDIDPNVNPGATEFCDTVDNDCDTLVDMNDPDLQAAGGDGDGDGDAGLTCGGTDCDDTNPDVHPGAPEVCDTIDNDCDTFVDADDTLANGATAPYYVGDDADGDGFDGPCGTTVVDCDDSDDTVFPGAPEFCDGKDNDCDTLVDMADPDLLNAPVPGDGDGDGFAGLACGGPDCLDTDPTISPAAAEICGDSIDNDCSGREGDKDADDDGHVDDDPSCDSGDDCDDDNPNVNPSVNEVCNNGIDDNCSGAENDRDADGDGEISVDCAGLDCDDDDDTVNTSATEVCDGKDTDCNGSLLPEEEDNDGDGYVECLDACVLQEVAARWYTVPHDPEFELDGACDDGLHGVDLGFAFPLFGVNRNDAIVTGNGFVIFDTNFGGGGPIFGEWNNQPIPHSDIPNGVVAPFWDDLYVDCGGGGGSGVYAGVGGSTPNRFFVVEWSDARIEMTGERLTFQAVMHESGTVEFNYQSMSPETAWTRGAGASIGLESITGMEGAQFSYNTQSLHPNMTVAYFCGTDCNDIDENVFPGAPEACNGEDTDCDGTVDNKDLDSDAYIDEACGGLDCNDDDPNINPDATETCGDGTNSNCDAGGDDNDKDSDGDGYTDADPLCGGDDCDDDDPEFNPGATEICDGLDNDCDGQLGALEQDGDNDGFAGCTLVCDRLPEVLVLADFSSGPDIRDAILDRFNPGEGPEVDVASIGSWDTNGMPASDYDVIVFADGGVNQWDPQPNQLNTAEIAELTGFASNGGGLVLFELTAQRAHMFGQEAMATLGLFDVPAAPNWTGDGTTWNVNESHPITEGLNNRFNPGWSYWFRDAVARAGTLEVIRGDEGLGVLVRDSGTSGRTVHLNLGGNNQWWGFQPFDDDDLGQILHNAVRWTNQCTTFKANDCDDTNEDAFPGAPEYCDGVDTNCNSILDEVNDGDGDGQNGIPCGGLDCDDTDATVYDGAPEICDTKDNDCDGQIDEVGDGDGDGQNGVACGGPDCDDGNPLVYSGAPELCDGVDNNCNGQVDMDDPELQAKFGDGDSDGFAGALCGGADCDDTDVTINPGADEVCGDGIDNNCSGQDGDKDKDSDGHIDDDPLCDNGDDCDDDEQTTNPSAIDVCGDAVDNDCNGTPDDKDADQDGQIDDTCTSGTDCDDSDPATFFGAPEICDLKDNDCDGSPGSDETDDDGDGYVECEPGLVPVAYQWFTASDGPWMQDCDQCSTGRGMSFSFPFYGDSYSTFYASSNGFVAFDSLWAWRNDNQSLPFGPPPYGMIAPFWDDLWTGYGAQEGLFLGSGGTPPDRYQVMEWRNFHSYNFNADLTFQVVLFENGNYLMSYQDLTAHEPGSENEAHGGGATVGVQNWDGTEWSQYSFNQPVLFAPLTLTYVPGGDCDDDPVTGPDVYPGAPEICDGKDNDCNTVIDDKDIDGDGHIDDDPLCGGTDCNDDNSEVNPDVDEICGDGIDNNCSGAQDDRDVDGDTFISDDPACGGNDCNDNDPDRYPGAQEQCNGEDDDCDGSPGPLETDDDGDGYVECDLTGTRDPEILVLTDARNQPEIRNALNSHGLTATERQIGNWDPTLLPASNFDVIVFADGLNEDGGAMPTLSTLTAQEITALTGFAASGGGLVLFELAGGRVSAPPVIPPGQDLGSLPLFQPDLRTFRFFTDDDWRVNPGMEGHPAAQNLGTEWFYLSSVMMAGDITSVAPDAQHLIQTQNAPLGVLIRDQGVGGNRTVHFNLLGAHDSTFFGSSNPFTDDNVRTMLADACRWTNQTGVFLGNDCDDDPVTGPDVYPGAPEYCDGKDNNCDTEIDEADLDDFLGDRDGDTYVDENCGGQDCNDGDIAINPDAVEVCDSVDNDCDDLIDGADDDVQADDDSDGHDSELCGGDDCDDTNPLVFLGATEICDGVDNDCDDLIDMSDPDLSGTVPPGDGDGDGEAGLLCSGPDCDDSDAAINTSATEVCDDIDNNCDLVVDPGCNDDADGYCDENMTTVGNPLICPDGGGDCNDDSDVTYPGAIEICDGLDNDCVGGLPADEQDPDGDGWMACDPQPVPVNVLIIGEGGTGVAETDLAPILANAGNLVQLSPVPFGTYNGENLADKQVAILAADIMIGTGWSYNPMPFGGRAALESFTQAGGLLIALEPVGFVAPETVWTDLLPSNPVDGLAHFTPDTYRRAETVPAGQEKIWTDVPLAFIADGPWFEMARDAGDTVLVGNPAGDALVVDEAQRVAQFAVAGAIDSGGVDLHPFRDSPEMSQALINVIDYFYRAFGNDCDEISDTINPGAVDICGDTEDNNCNGQDDETADNDLDGENATACGGPDCDDLNHRVNTTAQEYCDGIDNNCAGGIDEVHDGDGDGHDGELCDGDDCDDSDPNVYFGAPEICDGKDNDCDGDIDSADPDYNPDADGDGDPAAACGGTDCDDSDPNVYMGAPEICDGKDNDCDFLVDQTDPDYQGDDFDQDGENGSCVGGNDCNDANPAVNSTATEICDGQDNNCDTNVDEGFDTDSDPNNCGGCGIVCSGPHATYDCTTGNCTIDICDTNYSDANAIDADGCESYTCIDTSPEVCDEIDNDCDGFVDEEDDGIQLQHITTVSANDSITRLEIVGDRLYASTFWGLAEFDISQPAMPQLIDNTCCRNNLRDVALFGDIALLPSNSSSDLEVFATNPPQSLNTAPLAGTANNIEMLGPQAFITDYTGTWQLARYDVSNPFQPQRLGGSDSPGVPGRMILTDGGIVVVPAGTSDMVLFDTSGSGDPAEITRFAPGAGGQYKGTAESNGVLYAGHFAFGNGDLQTITLWDQVNLGSQPVSGHIADLTTSGDTLVAVGDAEGPRKLWAWRIEEPTTPLAVGEANIDEVNGTPEHVRASGEYVYVNDSNDSIWVYRLQVMRAGSSCTGGLGECRSEGTWYCDPGGIQCDATPGTPSPEVCDGLDNNCDGITDNKDTDQDGDIDENCNGFDCDDNDPTIWGSYPQAPEVCDNKDNDCDMLTDAADPDFQGDDSDGDGFNGSCAGGGDCNDANPTVFPGATELCNGIDDNCAGGIDEIFMLDTDPNNCGFCGRVCSGFQVAADENSCVGGECEHNIGAPNGGCAPGWSDGNADPTDGCEAYTCTYMGPETCDGAGIDEDCNGDVNEDTAGVNPATISVIDLKIAEVQHIALDTDRNLVIAVGENDTPDVTFEIWDVSDPAAPTERGSLSSSEVWWMPYNLAIEGTIAVVSSDWYFGTVDIADPDNPRVLFMNDIDAYSSWFGNIEMSGGYAYLPDDGNRQLTVVDVRDPTNPRVVGSATTTGGSEDPSSVTVNGDRLYLTTQDWSLHVFDISNPTNPVEIDSALTSEHLLDVVVGGQMAHVTQIDGDYFAGMDLRPGASLEPVMYQVDADGDHPYHQLAIDDGFLYAAGDDVTATYPGEAFIDVYSRSSISAAATPPHRIGRITGLPGFGNPQAKEMLTDGQGLLYLAGGWWPDSQIAIVQPNPEVWMGPCSEGLGICRDTGTFDTCNGGNIECSATAGTPEEEVCGDELDNDCNGYIDDRDIDGDGHISTQPGCDGDDCCDEGFEGSIGCAVGTRDAINPSELETCNDIDDNCSGFADDPWDIDGDRHFAPWGCHAGDGDDCDDNEPNAFPGNIEGCDGFDNDCDGAVDQRDDDLGGAPPLDLDGYSLEQYVAAWSYVFPPTFIPNGGHLVVARNADLPTFEGCWGPLPPGTVYVNSGDMLPKINGDEYYELYDNLPVLIDGPTYALDSGAGDSHQRIDATFPADQMTSWLFQDQSFATPGAGGVGVGDGSAGLVISEISDAPSFACEFVELFFDGFFGTDTDGDGDGEDGPSCGGLDCNDSDPEVYSTNEEVCDGKDNNCNGMTDEGCGPKCYTTQDICPMNTTCFAYAGNTDGVGECFLFTNGNLQMGEFCGGDGSLCQSGICGGHMVPDVCNDICATDRHCDPNGLKCYLDFGRSSDGRIGGMCGVNQGPFSFGDSCGTPDSCESNTCLPYMGGGASDYRCSDLCCSNNDCPPDFLCGLWNAGGEEHFKACTHMNDVFGYPPGPKQLGEACADGSECESGLCSGECTQSCCEDSECAPSQICDLGMYGPTLTMLCQPPPPQP